MSHKSYLFKSYLNKPYLHSVTHLRKAYMKYITPDDCKKHGTQCSVLELSCCLIQPFVIFI